MSKHLQRDLDALKQDLLEVGTRVEEAVEKSILAFQERNLELAQKVIKDDDKIDKREVEVEEECLKMLALHQPVAQDLRFIAAVIKMNNDLERMGDCAAKMARRTLSLVKDPPISLPSSLWRMTDLTLKMVRGCLDSFVKRDPKFAREICVKDDEVDQINRSIIKDLRRRMHEHPDQIDQALDIISFTQRIERIADLATNIAQDVVYLVEGEIIRHKR